MKTCTVVATFEPLAEYREEIRSTLLEQAKLVRLEPGCEYYDLYDQVNGNLVFVEAWSTRELWQQHNNAQTVKTIQSFIEGKLKSPVLVQELYEAK